MSDIQNSTLLSYVIDLCKKIGNKEGAATAERFFAALLSVIDGSVKADENTAQEIEKCANILKNCFEGDLSALKIAFINTANDEQSYSYMDGLYFQKKLCDARLRAASLKVSVIDVTIVLEVLLKEPNEKMQKCFREALSGSSGGSTVRLEKELGKKIAANNEPEFSAPEGKEDAKKFAGNLTDRVKKLQNDLSQVVFGQDNAISIFTTGYFQAELLSVTDKTRKRPGATFLFAGPPGVGKTFLAEKAAEALKLPFMRFDMSEYSNKEANIEFCGSDKVYKDSKPGNVTSFVDKNPKCVLLFDEIEKAHINVIHLFLQLLDAGRLRDNHTDKEVSFTDAIIIFTTNAGRPVYEDTDSTDFSMISRKVILGALQKDANPETGVPYFPAAMCSRFASGNVVMFNHMSAKDLVGIAKREVLRHAKNFENEIGIKVEIDERVFTSLIFAQGGAADARTVRSRAEAFFDDEIYELFRLMDADGISYLDKIKITADIPQNNAEIAEFFRPLEKTVAMVFASDKSAAACNEISEDCNFICVENNEQALNVLRNNEVKLVLVDMFHGSVCGDKKYLNIEDIDSASRDFFKFIREYHSELPVYLLECDDKCYSQEEKVSFMRHGVRGTLCASKTEEFKNSIVDICESIHSQNSMRNLAKSNKLISYETAQILNSADKTAEIKLFDFKLSVAVDSEDSGNILSNLSKPDVTFDKVIGAEDAKKELKYFVEYLKNPKKYLGTGVHAPKGVLLYGPPGTGKTLLAKAMAGESDVTFITAEGNQFLKKYVGEGSEKVHELFKIARKYAPSILFVDEIDAIGKERRGGEQSGSEATLTAFLTEMDGFKSDPTKPVFVLAATNFDVEPGGNKSLDPALMRRFDRRVFIDLPKREDRVKYLNMKISKNKSFEISTAKFENIAVRSTGMSLAELESVLELSLRMAIRDGEGKVTDDILDEAFETFNSGEKKTWDESTLERVARHEAGHAFMYWHDGETPSYLTIVARGNHGGYMQHADNEGKAISTREDLLALIRTSLAGRAAEIAYYGDEDGISTGASGDLSNATRTAQRIVCTYGMDDDFGLAVVDSSAANSGALSSEVRKAVNAILSQQMEKTLSIIKENKASIDALVAALMEKNQLTGDEIDAILKGNK